MIILKVQDLAKVYNERGPCPTMALAGMNLEIGSGEFTAIMGPSGSGKTTLLNILSGIDSATSGTVEILGTDVCRLSEGDRARFRRQRLGFVFQEFNLLDSLSIRQNVLLPLILDKQDPATMEPRVRDVLSLFDITSIADKHPSETSGGQQQRAAVSRAVINDPGILLADEPTGNLDSRSADAVMRCFQMLNARGHTILMVTHDSFAASFCSRVIMIRDGTTEKVLVRNGPRRTFQEEILKNLPSTILHDNDV